MRVRAARHSEHAQNISKWRPTMSLATECVEKVGSEHEKTMVPRTCAHMESIHVQTKVRGQVSLELALEEMKERRMTICLFLHSWFRHV